MSARGLLDLLRVTPGVAMLYAATSVIAVMGTFSGDGTSPLALLAVAVSITVIAVAVAMAAQAVLVDLGMPSAPSFFVALVLAGAVRALVLTEGLRIIGAQARGSLASLAVTSVISIVVWMSLVGLLEASRERYRRRYAALVLQASTAAAALDPGLDEHPDVIHLKSALSAVEPSAAPHAVASAIRTEIETSLRPLGHRIWFSSQDAEPHARIGRLLGDALIAMPVPVVAVTALWCVGAVTGGLVLFGPLRGALSAVLSTAVLLICLALSRAVVRPSRFGSGPIALVVCSTAPIILTDAVLHLLGYPLTVGSTLSMFLILALGAMILGAAAIALAASDREVILRLVASRVADLEAFAYEGLRGTPTELAGFLHNSLQSELHGLALQLDEAGRQGDDSHARAALERVGALAQRSLSEDFRSFRESPLERLERIQSAWDGIAVIDVVLGCEPEDERLILAVRAVEEITANAIRHGGARHVTVRITGRLRDTLSIELRSDGELRRESSGLGQGWLSSISQSGIEFADGPEGACIRLEL